MVLAELRARKRKHIHIQRVDYKGFLTAQTYIKNIKTDFVKIGALWDFAKVFSVTHCCAH